MADDLMAGFMQRDAIAEISIDETARATTPLGIIWPNKLIEYRIVPVQRLAEIVVVGIVDKVTGAHGANPLLREREARSVTG